METKISSLSQVFAPETAYYYGFPAESDSGFYNACPPEIEELVAMRPAVCAGPDLKIVTFANTVSTAAWRILEDDLGVKLVSKDQVIELPSSIDRSVKGAKRNEEIKRALSNMVADGKLVMAQPYVDDELVSKYLIKPDVTIWLND